ncbi:hypothetical protein M8C21_004064 [Ambrosia artemisiifolia]|uniref:Beta-amylase n=1 Tax=Ambrosia artemisiifolia TaxID=4212 RepID=A0AAD5C3N2_AMBAR|nr:hypothetical protein M8C21_004064 [Ambrosia artemisiifolia]
MIEGSIGMSCKCNSRCVIYSNKLKEFCFDNKKFNRKTLRNVSTVLVFKRRWRSVSSRSRIVSMDVREKSKSTLFESSKHKRVPIFVMMPIDSFGIDTTGAPRIRRIKALTVSLKALKLAGVHGIAVEVWWGVVERFFPHAYNWSLYEQLFKLVSETGLKLQVALSFHSSASQVQGVSLPQWIIEIGQKNKDIYYRDQNGFPNADYLTLGVDNIPLFSGRTALQCYEDFIHSFANKFDSLMGTIIEEVCVGLGPSGELRYPAHPLQDGRWKFPGIGAFQCYDKYMMEDLRAVAWQEGKPDWATKGPPSAGDYNSFPADVPFFEEGEGSFLSDYGHFFLEWYSDRLLRHADAVLEIAAKLLKKYQEDEQNSVRVMAKIGLLYWWYQTVSHPAELTAGYYNTAFRDGYDPLTSMLSRHGAALQISCFEMMDDETPETFLCSPESLLRQAGLKQIHSNCFDSQAEAVRSFTFFRMNEKIFKGENWNNFVPFVRRMNTDL